MSVGRWHGLIEELGKDLEWERAKCKIPAFPVCIKQDQKWQRQNT
jgi:hypothetical protein